jgi:hypothetical protein
MDHINSPLLGRQIGEVYKWLCFLNYICLKTDKKFANKLDDIQYILEAVSSNKDRDISETGRWWEQYYEDENCNEYATTLIKNVRNASRQSRLSLPAHKLKSLSFYFSEFRGLAISARAARDSVEHHISQGESKDLFATLYGAIALRIFDISKLLSDLVQEIAKSNQDEVARFSFRLVTASDEELNHYREITRNLNPSTAIPASRKNKDDVIESSEIVELLDNNSEERLIEQLQAVREEILASLDASKQEIIASMIYDGQKNGVTEAALEAASSPLHLDSRNAAVSLSHDQLFRELLDLRGKIYTTMTAKNDEFKHWHNILQRPIIAEICRTGCPNYESIKQLPGFKKRIIQAGKAFELENQERLFSVAIDQILSHPRRS